MHKETIHEALRRKLGREPTRDELVEDVNRILGRDVSPGGLSTSALYLGDNGRAFCGKLRCAGTSAHFTGRDLSGQRVMRLSAAQAREHGIKCERCGCKG